MQLWGHTSLPNKANEEHEFSKIWRMWQAWSLSPQEAIAASQLPLLPPTGYTRYSPLLRTLSRTATLRKLAWPKPIPACLPGLYAVRKSQQRKWRRGKTRAVSQRVPLPVKNWQMAPWNVAMWNWHMENELATIWWLHNYFTLKKKSEP